tara:strand:+ start:116 stop:628 length:513 start_codon:yes stop_codon:yes gene_type:complete
MGFDIYGLSPKINSNIDKTTVYGSIKAIPEFSDRLKMLEKLSDTDRDKYWKEHDSYEADNPGIYFRNNVWYWRPLWHYITITCNDFLSEKDLSSGTYNDGYKISKTKAMAIARRLDKNIKSGHAKSYRDMHEAERSKMGKKDPMSSYPFDLDNVKRFSRFCRESGGFKIW